MILNDNNDSDNSNRSNRSIERSTISKIILINEEIFPFGKKDIEK